MKYKVISIHFTTECNMEPRCPFCYRPSESKGKPKKFFIDLVKYCKELAPSIACGGGEPLCDKQFIIDFGKECKKQGVLFNFTTNGKEFVNMSDIEIEAVLADVTMISISLDKHKWGGLLKAYEHNVKRIRLISDVQIGCNLLIDDDMLSDNGNGLILLIRWLFDIVGVDRVFALYPKNFALKYDITSFKEIYEALTDKYRHFYVDDLTRMILEHGYKDWKKPCHYGRDLISIDEKCDVKGCSFDCGKVMTLNKPSDLLKMKEFVFEDRMECPYLKR